MMEFKTSRRSTILFCVSLGLALGCNLFTATSTSVVSTPIAPTEPMESPEYRNTIYGFSVSLPQAWEDYAVVSTVWEGIINDASQGDVVAEQGPLISIRHPKSTLEAPRQDIPIMVFTVEQWSSLQKGEWWIGAAPIPPSELARNDLYVFALPARYNYAFLEGWEEVEDIVQSEAIQSFEPDAPQSESIKKLSPSQEAF